MYIYLYAGCHPRQLPGPPCRQFISNKNKSRLPGSRVGGAFYGDIFIVPYLMSSHAYTCLLAHFHYMWPSESLALDWLAALKPQRSMPAISQQNRLTFNCY